MTIGSSPRGSRPVSLIVVHTAEGARTAENLASYFNKGGVNASSHVGIDDSKVLQYVSYDRAAWTLRAGNPISDNAELCGFASWSRDAWLTQHDKMLRLTASWIRSRCSARGISPAKLTVAQVGHGTWGVIGHVDWTYGSKILLGYQDGTHTDPGDHFPWDYVMRLVRADDPHPTLRGLPPRRRTRG